MKMSGMGVGNPLYARFPKLRAFKFSLHLARRIVRITANLSILTCVKRGGVRWHVLCECAAQT